MGKVGIYLKINNVSCPNIFVSADTELNIPTCKYLNMHTCAGIDLILSVENISFFISLSLSVCALVQTITILQSCSACRCMCWYLIRPDLAGVFLCMFLGMFLICSWVCSGMFLYVPVWPTAPPLIFKSLRKERFCSCVYLVPTHDCPS